AQRALRRASGRTTHEFVNRSGERQRALLDVLAQPVPRLEAVLARDHGLRIVQRETDPGELLERFAGERRQNPKTFERPGIVRAGGLQKRLGLLLELLEIRALGQGLRCHDNLHARACGSQSGSTDGWTCKRAERPVGSALRANLRAPGAPRS